MSERYGRMTAFTATYGLARFCGRGRVVSCVYGLRAVFKQRQWLRARGFDAMGRKRVGL